MNFNVVALFNLLKNHKIEYKENLLKLVLLTAFLWL